MGAILHQRQHQYHPPVHLQLTILFLCSCSSVFVSVRSSPITIVLSHLESPFTASNDSVVNFEPSNSTYHDQTEIFQSGSNKYDSSSVINNRNVPQAPATAAASTAIVKARATSLPRQEFYLQDKRTGSGSGAVASGDATTTSAKHVLGILENYTPAVGSSGVDNVSILHRHGYGYGYGSGIDDEGEYGERIVIRIDEDDGATYRVRKLPVVNSPFQFGLLVLILLVSLTANGCVIVNVSRDSLKLKMIHFLLIRHVCLTDFLGTLFILPLPMVAIIRGEWTESATSNHICAVVSTTTALFWTMHLIAVALYRTDRVLAVWLPSGRYPVCSIRVVNFCLVSVWLTAIAGSCLATFTFGYTFQPALALCIPDVPIIFFIVVFSGYCIGLIALSTGYILAFARKRKRRRRGRKAQILQAQMAAAVGVAQRCLLHAATPRCGSVPNHNNISSLVPNNVVNVVTTPPERTRTREDEAFTLCNSEAELSFEIIGNHQSAIVNVLQHQMTGFSDDFVPSQSPAPQLQEPQTRTQVQDTNAGDFDTKNCSIRNSTDLDPQGHNPNNPDDDMDPDKTPTPATFPETPQFGFSGNVNALPSCTITPNRPSPLAFPEPADDASTADSAEESATTPTGPPPAPPIEPVVKCPHHLLEQGYQVLRSSSDELSSSSPSTDSDSGSSSCMLPAGGGADGGSSSGSDKKKILRKKKTPNRIARITHQSLSLTFSNTINSASAPPAGRIKSAGTGTRNGRRIPTHSKSFDCYYDLLKQRFDGASSSNYATAIVNANGDVMLERPHSVHVAEMDSESDRLNHDQDHTAEDLELALVQEPRTVSRASRGSRIRTPTPIPEVSLNPVPAVAIGQQSQPNSRESSCKSSSHFSSSLVNYNNAGEGNGTYSNSLDTQDDEEEDHSPYIDVIHDQIDHFRFHVHERHSRHGSSGTDKTTYIMHHGIGFLAGKDKGKVKKKRHRTHHHGHHLQHHKHAKKSTSAKKRALLSYALSVGHLLLYLPAMFVVGLQGASLPPGAALFCGIVVYCEFLIQPAALMILSHRLRTEITRMLTRRPSTLAVSRSNQLI